MHLAELVTWDGLEASPRHLNGRTLGWGTRAQQNAITTWENDGYFFNTEEGVLYQNVGTNILVQWLDILMDDVFYISRIVSLV